MTATSMPTLRPLGIGELLDQSIRLYRRNFLSFIGIIAVVQIPLGLLQFGLSLVTLQTGPLFGPSGRGASDASQLSPLYFASLASTVLVAVVQLILVQGVATAAMTRAVADNYLGTPTGFSAAYRRIGRAWLPLIGTLFLAAVVGVLLTIWFLVPCVGWATGLGLLAFYGAVIVPMVAPIVVLEGKRGWPAVHRAWDLARRRFWPLVGFVTLILIFNLIVIGGPNLVIQTVFQVLINRQVAGGAAGLGVASVIVQSLVSLIFSLLYVPLQLIAFTLLYFDLRVRTEGLDLAMLTQDAAAGAEAVVAGQAPEPERGGLVTGRDLGNFFLLSLGLGGIYAVLIGAIFVLAALVGLALGGAGVG